MCQAQALWATDQGEDPEGDVAIHPLGATFGTDLVEAGADINAVQRLMRHKSGNDVETSSGDSS